MKKYLYILFFFIVLLLVSSVGFAQTVIGSVANNGSTFYYSNSGLCGLSPTGLAVTTSGICAGATITNVNIAINATNIQYWSGGWYCCYAQTNCGSYFNWKLTGSALGTTDAGGCGGNESNWNGQSPNQTWTLTCEELDGLCWAMTMGYTVTVTYSTAGCCTAPGFSAQPNSPTICTGGTAVVSVTATGTAPITYQWYQMATNCATPTIIGGANSSSYTTPVLTTGTYYGTCVATNACGTLTSNCGVISVNATSTAPTSATASNSIVCSGGASVLTLNGGGGGTGTVIKWYTGSCGGTLVGTGNNLTVNPVATTTYYGRYEDPAPCSVNTSCQQVTVTVDLTAPTTDNVTVNSTCWVCDNAHTYTITAVSTEAGVGWGGTWGILTLINYQGPHGAYPAASANNGGFFAWNTTTAALNAAGFTANQSACTGGGFVGKYAASYGNGTVTLVSASTSLVGNTRTVNFVVTPNNTFPIFVANDISEYATDICNNASAWVDFSSLFASSLTAPVSSAGPDQYICASPATMAATGTGTWTQIGGAAATITTPGSATSTITGLVSGTYGFRWTNGCGGYSDMVIVVQ